MNPWLDSVAGARDLLRDCRLCPRDCGVDRTQSATGAFCRLDDRAWVYKELLSLGEEPEISPTWLIDVGGCSLRCLFCTEWDYVTNPQHGSPGPTEWESQAPVVLDPHWFAAQMTRRIAQGARTLTFVGGDPTVNLPAIVAALAACEAPLPVVWNCNSLGSKQAWALLQGRVATFSLDAKFGNAACAQRLAGFVDEAAEREAFEAALNSPQHTDLPQLIVRHLLMPGHLDCCTRPVLQRLTKRLAGVAPDRALVNLMTTFVPPAVTYKSAPELGNWNASSDVRAAVALARDLLGERLRVDGRRPNLVTS